ncbi:MAG: hypothetical protein EBT22_13205 [Chloroflexi bacterium]|nr:hypothetical protein [Chloroflexota bacterium]
MHETLSGTIMTATTRTFFIENLGCPKNAVEGEGMAERLRQTGYSATDDAADADVPLPQYPADWAEGGGSGLPGRTVWRCP